MLARIKFTDSSKNNYMKESEFKDLEKYIGEPIKSKALKVDENGKPTTIDWRETFDESEVEKNSDYKLVEKSEYVSINSDESYIVDLNKFMNDYPDLEYSVKGLPKAVSTDNIDLINTMTEVANKIEEAKNKFDRAVEFNQRCEVHVPNLGLLNINKLAYAEDYCTVELQRLLQLGWRIIAVCPQPNQRRPDYILGMNVSNMNDDAEVHRFSSSK